MCRAALSRPVPVDALVGRHPTNKLIGHGPLPGRRSFAHRDMRLRGIIRYYRRFRKGTEVPPLSLCPGYVIHALLTRSPLIRPKTDPLDLHALATPPAFVLSQDQTLHLVVRFQKRPRPKPRTRGFDQERPCPVVLRGHEPPTRQAGRRASLLYDRTRVSPRPIGLFFRPRAAQRTWPRETRTHSQRQTCSLVKEQPPGT